MLARDIDAQARAVRQRYEDTVAAPERKASEDVAKARFDIEGASVDPDATFTLRLSYGTVKGFPETTGYIAPYTTIGGLFNRATGAEPYVLPQSWLTSKPSLDVNTAMNSTIINDIIGGNSGSPLINKNAEVCRPDLRLKHSFFGAVTSDSTLLQIAPLQSIAVHCWRDCNTSITPSASFPRY